jgi:hypothetical protein
MRKTLALILLFGLSGPIAEADDKPAPPPPTLSTLAPEKDWRLAKQPDAQLQKIGVLTYYPNNGGGYTFTEDATILFCALPYEPTTRQIENMVLSIVGPSKMPFGGQTVYRSQIIRSFDEPHRLDTPIAKWTRDSPNGKFRLSIMADDSETRLKLKSIVPVLEHAEHVR